MTHEIIDLSMLKDTGDHQHVWSVLYTFTVPDETIDAIMANLALPEEERITIEFNPGQDDFVTMQGPGCLKCRIKLETGYGQLCPVSSKEFYQANNLKESVERD